MTQPHIVIDREGDAFPVRVEPAGEGDNFATSYPSHKGAASYASMVSRLRGWPVDDRSGEAAHV